MGRRQELGGRQCLPKCRHAAVFGHRARAPLCVAARVKLQVVCTSNWLLCLSHELFSRQGVCMALHCALCRVHLPVFGFIVNVCRPTVPFTLPTTCLTVFSSGKTLLC